MKVLLFFAMLMLSISATAQNVGIGTITPAARLEVHDNVNSALRVSSGNRNDSSRLMLSNRDNLNAGTDYSIIAVKDQGLTIATRSDVSANNSDSLLVLKANGRLGLGVKNPAAKLDVDGGIKIAGFNSIELGGGVAGKEPNAGKIGYRTFTNDALEIVGAGTSSTDRKVFVYAEGGATFNGPLNSLGPIQINGNSGTAGQVLSSNGTSAPSWTDAAYANTDRFGVKMSTSQTNGGICNLASTLYNTNTADVIPGPSGILINRAGLYHFNGAYTIKILVDQDNEIHTYPVGMSLVFGGALATTLTLDNAETPGDRVNYFGPTSGAYMAYSNQFSQDVYISGPTTLQASCYYYDYMTYPGSADITIFGYRISN